MPDVELEERYASPPPTVWLAISDPHALSAWLMPTTDFAPRVGAAVSFRTAPKIGFDGTVDGEVLEAAAPTRLAYTWRGAGVDTVVELTLVPEPDGGTTLRLRQTGFLGLRGRLVARVLRSGWRHRLGDRLRATLELLDHEEPAGLDPEMVAQAAGDREDDLDVRGLLRRWTQR